MKKLYTTLLAACTLFAASAAQPEAITATLTASQQAEKTHNAKVKPLKASDFNLGEVKGRGQQRLGVDKPTTEEYTWVSIGKGLYASSILAEIYGGMTDPVEVDIFEAEEKPGLYKAVGVWPDFVKNGELIVDASDPSFIKVKKQATGYKDTVDGDTYIASMTWVLTEEEGFEPSLVAQALPEMLPKYKNGSITFPPQSLALQWPNAPINSEYGTDPTEWYIGDKAGALVLPGGEYDNPWTLIGEGTVSGDMYYSVCDISTFDKYKVQVSQYSTDKNTYRIDNPLKGLYAALSISSESPFWELDASDPNEVTLNLTSIGIGTQSEGTYFAATTNLDYRVGECPAEYLSTLTTDENTLTFKFPKSGLLVGKAKTGDVAPANTTDVTIVVKFKDTGIGSIEAVDNKAPVEYFNLQGVRIANPIAGQLMIKRQGTKVTKEIVK